MLISVSGWSAPSFVLRVSKTYTLSRSASSHRPYFLYVDARLAMLVSVSGWWAPSFVLRVSMTYTKSCSASSYRPDNRLLASASHDHTMRLWDSVTGVLYQTLEGHLDLVTSMTFSPDSRLLTSASDDKTVRFWDSATGT
ncbi:hypothetical protein PENARI_c003G00881 [Penicillium arizonense]|uniref:Uncharacterized protein n=1 Tax=Penicillium arizonense TaxID=1835702 RepID=A0A1F5LSR1_PENAI|nr:hypothetical protein PENARI_c003G00881 [Penicillium arizonense]OGE56253.1 hypothetical protein PENARI_c003G00881 [Penicillium arizonense]